MARLFDTSDRPNEFAIANMNIAIQQNAMSMMERQQQMRLRELQNDRQQMLAETQIKMNEANLSAMEYDLALKQKTQDLVLAKTKYDMNSALMDMNTKQKFMEESIEYKSKEPELSKKYQEIMSIKDPAERMNALSGFSGQAKAIANSYKLSGYASWAEIADSQYKNEMEIYKANISLDQTKRLNEYQEQQAMALSEKFPDRSITVSKSGTSIGGTTSQAKPEKTIDEIEAKKMQNPAYRAKRSKDIIENLDLARSGDISPKAAYDDYLLYVNHGGTVDGDMAQKVARLKDKFPNLIQEQSQVSGSQTGATTIDGALNNIFGR